MEPDGSIHEVQLDLWRAVAALITDHPMDEEDRRLLALIIYKDLGAELTAGGPEEIVDSLKNLYEVGAIGIRNDRAYLTALDEE